MKSVSDAVKAAAGLKQILRCIKHHGLDLDEQVQPLKKRIEQLTDQSKKRPAPSSIGKASKAYKNQKNSNYTTNRMYAGAMPQATVGMNAMGSLSQLHSQMADRHQGQ